MNIRASCNCEQQFVVREGRRGDCQTYIEAFLGLDVWWIFCSNVVDQAMQWKIASLELFCTVFNVPVHIQARADSVIIIIYVGQGERGSNGYKRCVFKEAGEWQQDKKCNHYPNPFR